MCNFMKNAVKQTALKYYYSKLKSKTSGAEQWYIIMPIAWVLPHPLHCKHPS